MTFAVLASATNQSSDRGIDSHEKGYSQGEENATGVGDNGDAQMTQ